MLDIQVNETQDGKANVELKLEGSVNIVALQLHIVMKHITEKFPEVAEELYELALAESDEN